MKHNTLKVHAADNVLVALRDMKQGEAIQYNGNIFLLKEEVPAKHKFTIEHLKK
ncbi:hypothetical protein [Parafilimonas sp.]|uniref:hypothetical protein n=1 Tax=Parafilimonas sp. TaxID=1969739 RepID=UPI0039E68EB9